MVSYFSKGDLSSTFPWLHICQGFGRDWKCETRGGEEEIEVTKGKDYGALLFSCFCL